MSPRFLQVFKCAKMLVNVIFIKKKKKKNQSLQTVDSKTHLPSSLECVLLECRLSQPQLRGLVFQKEVRYLKMMIHIKTQYFKKYDNI